MDQRGLLKETLVVAIGEFGRSPRIGRQHVGQLATPPTAAITGRTATARVVAGAGIARGAQYGESDATASSQRKAGTSQRPAGDDLLRARHRPGHGDSQPPEPAARTGQRQDRRRPVFLTRQSRSAQMRLPPYPDHLSFRVYSTYSGSCMFKFFSPSRGGFSK